MEEISATMTNPKTGKAYAINPNSGVWDDNYFDANWGNYNRGIRATNQALDAPIQAIATQRTNNQAFLNNQNNQTNDFLNRYRGTLAGQESTNALAERIGQELGLPQLQANARSLNQTIFNLPQTYSKAMTGYDVNQNQLDRVVGTKQAELAPAAALASQNAQAAETNLNTRLGYAQRDQDRQLLPYQMEQNLMSERFARETTLYSQENQAELDALIAKANARVSLTEGEKNRMHQLAMQEAEFENALKVARENRGSESGGNPYVTLGEGQTLYNTSTNQPVYTAIKTYKPSSGGASGSDWG